MIPSQSCPSVPVKQLTSSWARHSDRALNGPFNGSSIVEGSSPQGVDSHRAAFTPAGRASPRGSRASATAQHHGRGGPKQNRGYNSPRGKVRSRNSRTKIGPVGLLGYSGPLPWLFVERRPAVVAVPYAMLQAARRWGPWPPSLAVWRIAHTGQSP